MGMEILHVFSRECNPPISSLQHQYLIEHCPFDLFYYGGFLRAERVVELSYVISAAAPVSLIQLPKQEVRLGEGGARCLAIGIMTHCFGFDHLTTAGWFSLWMMTICDYTIKSSNIRLAIAASHASMSMQRS
jgi:hypothetical protein